MEKTIERLKLLSDRAKKYYWKDESEVVVKLSDVRAVLDFYEKTVNVSEYTEQELSCKAGCTGPCGQCKDEPQNAPDITPEWDEIYHGFMYVSIDKCGEEHSYTHEPFPDEWQWRGGGQWNKTGRLFDMAGIDWTKTLSKRPSNR